MGEVAGETVGVVVSTYDKDVLTHARVGRRGLTSGGDGEQWTGARNVT